MIAEHDKLKSIKQSAVANRGSFNNVLFNTHGKVPTHTSTKINQSSSLDQQTSKFPSQNFMSSQSLSVVSSDAFINRTANINTMKNPALKAFKLTSEIVSNQYIPKKSTLPLKSINECQKDILNRKINSSVEGSIKFSKLQCPRNTLKDSKIITPCLNKLDNISKHVESLQSKVKAPLQKYPKSYYDVLYKEITAITEKLKQANEVLSSNKACKKSISPSNLANGYVAKSKLSRVLAPKRSPSYCLTKNTELLCLQSSKLEAAVGSMPNSCIKSVKELQNARLISTPSKVVKSPVGMKRKVASKVISSKFKIVNKKSPASCPLTSGISAPQTKLNSSRELQFKKSQREMELKLLKAKATLLNSKFEVVNKNYVKSNLKSNIPEFPSPKNLKTSMHILSKKRKSFECMNRNKKLKTDELTSMKSDPTTSTELLLSKSHPKSFENSNSKLHVPIRPKMYLNSESKSQYKVINKTPRSSWSEISKGSKPRSSKLFDFSTDVDLLMELAAEKKDTPKPRVKSVLYKRMFKSKNTIINKNISSAQIKTAKIIKSKYFMGNKKHLPYKQARTRNFSDFRNYRGGFKKFQTKFNPPLFYDGRIKRNHFKHKISNYGKTHFSRNTKKMQYSQNRFVYGTHKGLKRISGNRTVFTKSNVKKQTSPVSKHLASRVLQHSINRVLTASIKKKTSKVDTYCMFYNRFGRCNKGTKCTYVHDPSKIAICTRFLRGTCKDENCLFSHEICPGKMAICSFFLTNSCTKTNCPYRHEMLSPGAELCKAFVQGYCNEGKQCKKAHILVCPDYVKGFCSKGNACAFPHPPPKEKKIIEKAAEKCENQDTDEFLMERVSRYFQPLNEETSPVKNETSNSVIPKRKTLPEQPSFISLSFNG